MTHGGNIAHGAASACTQDGMAVVLAYVPNGALVCLRGAHLGRRQREDQGRVTVATVRKELRPHPRRYGCVWAYGCLEASAEALANARSTKKRVAVGGNSAHGASSVSTKILVRRTHQWLCGQIRRHGCVRAHGWSMLGGLCESGRERRGQGACVAQCQ